MSDDSYLPVDWPDNKAGKPENVFAVTTLVNGGVSKGDYSGFNLASHVGDDLAAVGANRAKLVEDLGLPSEPVWLDQVHSNKVIRADGLAATGQAIEKPMLKADASISGTKGVVCAY
jgi:copper oxidase (laccase) domain-containing protein